MTILSASEDFLLRTVAAIPGLWARLEYVSSLQRGGGSYEHWGLQRMFGENAAREAIEQAHRDLVLEVLRTPVRQLVHDLFVAADRQECSVTAYIEQLESSGKALLPPQLGGGSARHFNTVLQSLAVLARKYTAANRQAS